MFLLKKTLINGIKYIEKYKANVDIGGKQMVIDNMLAYAEMDEILSLLEDEYKEKVPEKIRQFFKEEKMNDYQPKIDIDKPLIEQNLKREPMVLLAILNLNYWCNSEEEKQNFLNELAENEKEKKELEERYNPDNLFKNKKYDHIEDIDNKNKENVSLVEYKQKNLFKRILEKITVFFKRK